MGKALGAIGRDSTERGKGREKSKRPRDERRRRTKLKEPREKGEGPGGEGKKRPGKETKKNGGSTEHIKSRARKSRTETSSAGKKAKICKLRLVTAEQM